MFASPEQMLPNDARVSSGCGIRFTVKVLDTVVPHLVTFTVKMPVGELLISLKPTVAVVLLIPLMMLPKLALPVLLRILHSIKSGVIPPVFTEKVAVLLGQNCVKPLLFTITGLFTIGVTASSSGSELQITPFFTACFTTCTVPAAVKIAVSCCPLLLPALRRALLAYTLHKYIYPGSFSLNV